VVFRILGMGHAYSLTSGSSFTPGKKERNS
jgi:hypothetical protein